MNPNCQVQESSNLEKPEEAGPKTSTGISQSLEMKWVVLLCFVAAVHVFIFSAAFPFFNNVDEYPHFDLVLKYAHGEMPRELETFSGYSISYLVLIISREYFQKPNEYAGGKFPPPPWTLPAEEVRQILSVEGPFWQKHYDYEVSQPPLYYVLAAAWWHLGGWLGFQDGGLVYWLRFLNIALIVALVWLAYMTTRLLFPDNVFLKLSVPALVACMPQTAFYSLGNDMLSALCFGITFFLLIRWLRSESPSVAIGAATGMAFGATYLAKITNLPLLALAAAAILFKSWQDARHGKLREMAGALVAFLCCAAPAVIAWTLWCKTHYGDATGSDLRNQFWGWTVKPFAQWWHHPIFSIHGFWYYLSGNLGTLWQGEFTWHGLTLHLPGTDVLYTLFSLVLLAAVLPALLPRSLDVTPVQRQAFQLGLACFVAVLGFFGLMSIAYDFHNCLYPSRACPYFVSGRLLLGALIPFLLLMVYGLDRLLGRFQSGVKFSALAAIVVAMLVLEIATDWPVFFSQYNWFHMP